MAHGPTSQQTGAIVQSLGELIALIVEASGRDLGGSGPGLMCRKAAAAYLDIGLTKLDAMVREGELRPPILVGGRPKFPRAELDKYISDQLREQRKRRSGTLPKRE